MADAFEDAWDVSKFDSNRAEIARQMQQAEQPPYVGDDEDLNLNIGGNQGDCCENLRMEWYEIFETAYYDEVFWHGESGMPLHEYLNELPCDEMISYFNTIIKKEFEELLAGEENNNHSAIRNLKAVYNDALQALERYNACMRGGFENTNFSDDFQASGDAFEDAWVLVKAVKRPKFPATIHQRPTLNHELQGQEGQIYQLAADPTDALNLLEDYEYYDWGYPWERQRGAATMAAKRLMNYPHDYGTFSGGHGALPGMFQTFLTSKQGSDAIPYSLLEMIMGERGGMTERYLEDAESKGRQANLGFLTVGDDNRIGSMLARPGLGGNRIMSSLMARALDDKGLVYDSTWSPSGARFMENFGHLITPSPKWKIRRGDRLGMKNDKSRFLSREGAGHSYFHDPNRKFFRGGNFGQEAAGYVPTGDDMKTPLDIEDVGYQHGSGVSTYHPTDDELWDEELDDEVMPWKYDRDWEGNPIVYPRHSTFPIGGKLGVSRIDDRFKRLSKLPLRRYDFDPDTPENAFYPNFIRVE
tara:strand:+ start:480 stop:2063 length:1584 start_codon:yes stop_codon:yes gene_type:complete